MIEIEEANKEEQNIKCKHQKISKSHKRPIIITAIILFSLVIISILILYFAGIPIIKYKGENTETIEYGEIYIDKGINVYTKFKNISNKVIVESNVNTSKVGNYNITYKVPYFNDYKIYTRTVNVVDTKAPSINLTGDTQYNLAYGTEYQEPGYTATDDYDGDITDKVVVTQVDVDKNNFEKHYTVSDSSGNSFENIRYIKITDDVAPKITLNGDSVISILTGSTYNEQGATAIDNKDGDLTKNIQISGNVDTSKNGTYLITYSVSDSNGNKTAVQRKVIVDKTQSTGIIYLTFDDGPSNTITPKILDILKEKGVNATFFIINYNDSTEQIVKRAVNEGNVIGIHGYSHDYSKIYTSVDACYDNIIKLQQKIYNSTGITTKVLRFPGGSSNTVSKKYCKGVMTGISQKVLKEGFKYYDWNVMSGDSGDVKTKEAVYNNVTKGIKPGRNNIVLMHDFSGNNKTLEALPGIIDYGLSNGYRFDVITTDTEMVTQKIQN
ncbi:MAG: polysaccharide deacetylase family protein [Clostridia bacterium]|nr:polysaccharide deacetylase family protein [Clostridia bacterium]